jgi:hypothetical protein
MTRALAAVLVLVIGTVSLANAQWLTDPTPGLPRTADGKPNLSASAPRTQAGTVDLSGIWVAECPVSSTCWQENWFFDLAKDLKPEEVVMTPWAASIQRQREAREHVDDPLGYCEAPGVPRINFATPFKIAQTPAAVFLLYEQSIGQTFRQVLMDGRSLPPITEPTRLGYSVGRWDGDGLVVETTGFIDGGWLDTRKGRPHSDALRVTERFERPSLGQLRVTITIDDRKAFTRPWTMTARFNLMPDTELLQSSCEGHLKTMEHRRIAPAAPEPSSPRTPPSP